MNNPTLYKMRCSICSRGEPHILDFFCPACVRNGAYIARLEHARVLLEKEKLGAQVESATNSQSIIMKPLPSEELPQIRNVWNTEMRNVEAANSKTRLEETRSSTNEVRKDIASLREQISQRKTEITERKQVMTTVGNEASSRQGTLLSGLAEARSKGTTSLTSLDHKSAANKAYLCREAAQLMRLRQKRRNRNGSINEQYSIAGLLLPDLREINNSRCTELTAVLTSTAHLVVLVSFYLGVRLPAEITIPYKDYPLPTINTPSSSFLGKKVDFPGSGSIPSISSSPTASRQDNRGSHRPRPLFVGSDDRDERLANVAKREPLAFNFFVEGIALLAWDIAWLCRSQNFVTGTNSWEDVCNIGKNLYQLILVPPQPTQISRLNSDRNIQHRKKPVRQSSSPAQETVQQATGKLGQASHLSTNSFLGNFTHSEVIRNWKYGKYTSIADALRKQLLTEMNNAEWELLEEQEWDDGGEQFDEAVFIKTKTMDGHEFHNARSIMTTKTHNEDPTYSNRVPGTSGWTKLKSRDRT